MKAIYSFTVIILLLSLTTFSQTPQAFKYQAVARNSSGTLITNQLVAFRITILQGGPTGTMVYQERQTYTTNNYGLANLEIGKGTVLFGTFNTINWPAGQMYIKIELDPAGGTSYLVMGTTELLSVPYSLYSNSTSKINNISDADGDTKVQVEKNPDEDIMRFDLGGTEKMVLRGNRLEIGDGNRNLFLGQSAGLNNTGTDNTAIGYHIMFTNSAGSGNTALGTESFADNVSGNNNTAIGYRALVHNFDGSYNSTVGYQSMIDNQTGSYNSAFGFYSLLLNVTGSFNTSLGCFANRSCYDGSKNTAVGYSALYSSYSGSSNVALGYTAGYYESSSNRFYVDNQDRGSLQNGRDKSLIYGVFDADPANQQLTINGKVGIGTANPQSSLQVYNSSGTSNIKIGGTTSGQTYMNMGTSANTNGYNMIQSVAALGTTWGDLVLNPSGGNVGIGNSSPGMRLSVKSTNFLDGMEIGNNSRWMRFLPGTVSLASYNPIVQAEDNAIIFSNGTVNQGGLVIAPWSVNSSGIRITGSGNIGIGTSDPQNKLHISATSNPLRLDGLQTTTYENYLVVDANGVVSKRTGTGGGASGWALTGNTLTGTEKFGSINNFPVIFYTNNAERFRISETGNVGIGTNSPTSNLHIVDNIGIPNNPTPFSEAGFKIVASSNLYALFLSSNQIESCCGTLMINQSNKMNTTFGGNVGIGTFYPTSRLDVTGNVTIRDGSSGAIAVELGTGLDYAEGFDVSNEMIAEPGTVLCIDPQHEGLLKISNAAYDYKVAGIVAGANGLGSGIKLGSGEFDYDVALAGRVYCNVVTSDEEITPGDLLTTSDIPGYAMKVRDFDKAKGAILGKAMESLAKNSQGQILVLVTLQ